MRWGWCACAYHPHPQYEDDMSYSPESFAQEHGADALPADDDESEALREHVMTLGMRAREMPIRKLLFALDVLDTPEFYALAQGRDVWSQDSRDAWRRLLTPIVQFLDEFDALYAQME